MSVLIKGITLDDFIRYGGEYAAYLDGTGCTVELPDHGDLIDRDVVADALDLMTAYHKLGNAYDWVKYDCLAVIPAERSEYGGEER